MSTWLANQSDQVTCQPGTMAMGKAGGTEEEEEEAFCSLAMVAFLGAGNDFGDTGEGDSIGESWSRSGVGVVSWL